MTCRTFNNVNSNRTSKISDIIRDIDKQELETKDFEKEDLKAQILSGNGIASKEFGNKEVDKKPRFIGQMAGKIAMIPIGNIERNANQPRESFENSSLKKLENSIRELGIIQPITVRKISALKYQIIAGERRFRAGQAAGLEEIPSYIREADDAQLLEMALVENVQRQDLHPIEVATSYQRLIEEFSYARADIVTRGQGQSFDHQFVTSFGPARRNQNRTCKTDAYTRACKGTALDHKRSRETDSHYEPRNHSEVQCETN